MGMHLSLAVSLIIGLLGSGRVTAILPTALVVMEEALSGSHEEYAKFFESIRTDNGYHIDRYLVHDTAAFEAPSLFSAETDENMYQTLYLLTSEIPRQWTGAEGGSALVRYVEKGGNLLVALDAGAGLKGKPRKEWQALLGNFGLELLAAESVLTRLSEGARSELHWNQAHLITQMHERALQAPAQSIGYRLKRKPANPLLHPLWMLPAGLAFCERNKCSSSSSSFALAATHESRAGARFVALGSPGLLRDGETAGALVAWLQGREGVAGVREVRHGLAGGEEPRNRGRSGTGATIYREGDRIDVAVCLSGGAGGAQQMQGELRQMGLVARFTLGAGGEEGCLEARDVALPQRKGVYTLRLGLQRPGATQLQHEERLVVRPLRDEERGRPWGAMGAHVLSWLGVLGVSLFVLLPALLRASGPNQGKGKGMGKGMGMGLGKEPVLVQGHAQGHAQGQTPLAQTRGE